MKAYARTLEHKFASGRYPKAVTNKNIKLKQKVCCSAVQRPSLLALAMPDPSMHARSSRGGSNWCFRCPLPRSIMP